jgi:hypothetical protein
MNAIHISKRFLSGVITATLLVLPLSYPFMSAHAAVSSWLRGSSIVPANTTDFSSSSFDQSLQNLKATGATSVALIIPYYQSNIYSTDIGAGYNTPTDASLASAIDYAHSIGLSVTLKVHMESYDGNWRAYINPSDRTTWFNNYGNVLVHLGQLAAAHKAELIVLGTEMVDMAASSQNSTNTQNWLTLIQKVRSVYSGKLTYGANSTNNNDDPFENEKKYVGFWSALDYAGLSAYYALNTGDNSPASLESAWDAWNKNDVQGFAQSVGKPILFTEVGYRSVGGAHNQPWAWWTGGGVDMNEQANDYQALLEYWNSYSYVQGVYFWDWSSNPSAGGSGSTEYTPQHKTAEQVMTKWFTSSPTPPPPTSTPVFSDSTATSPSAPTVNTPTTVTSIVKDISGSVSNATVDLEVYDASNNRVAQKFVGGQSFAAGTNQSYSVTWTPTSAGTYRATVGVFTSDWTRNYYWNNDARNITVGSGSTTPPPSGGGSGSQVTDVWWPTDNSHVSGVQPLKAMVENSDISQYSMTWSVDGGAPAPMNDTQTDYPHKEALIDFSNWKWRGAGPYTITIVSKDHSGTVISQKSIQIYTP